LIKNEFYQQVASAYEEGASLDDLKSLLGRGRAKKGMFEGDLNEGELEIGQISGIIDEVKPAAIIVEEILAEFKTALHEHNDAKYHF
jgi:enoyl-[acyl-carrier protein] reductase II